MTQCLHCNQTFVTLILNIDFYQKHRTGKQRDLTNILEESSSIDEPRSFEQDEQYLEECLRALDGNPDELQVKKKL